MAEWREQRYGRKMVEWREWLHTYYLRQTHTNDNDDDDNDDDDDDNDNDDDDDDDNNDDDDNDDNDDVDDDTLIFYSIDQNRFDSILFYRILPYVGTSGICIELFYRIRETLGRVKIKQSYSRSPNLPSVNRIHTIFQCESDSH